MAKKMRHEGPLKIPMKFDDAIRHALKVKPPEEGWAEYEKKLFGPTADIEDSLGRQITARASD
jgi:hypothetical protein